MLVEYHLVDTYFRQESAIVKYEQVKALAKYSLNGSFGIVYTFGNIINCPVLALFSRTMHYSIKITVTHTLLSYFKLFYGNICECSIS